MPRMESEDMQSRIIFGALCVASLIMAGGCSTMTKDKGTKKSTWEAMQFWKKGYQQPTKMAVLWSHDVLTVAGQAPTRGFGGRIYFYNERSQTIPVEGELTVHGYDETQKRITGASPDDPDKRFRFTQEQFSSHFSESDLGASYSVWIPWDAVDGVQKELTLIPTFRSSKGQVVQGTPAKVVLPGRAASPNGTAVPVQTVAYEQANVPTVSGFLQPVQAKPKEEGLRTTTIRLPAGLKRASKQNAEAATSLNMMQAPVDPAIQQARSQLIANALQVRPASATAELQPSATTPTAVAAAARQQMNSAWQPNMVPSASSMATTYNSITPAHWNGPATAEKDVDLPPGVQLSPRASTW